MAMEGLELRIIVGWDGDGDWVEYHGARVELGVSE